MAQAVRQLNAGATDQQILDMTTDAQLATSRGRALEQKGANWGRAPIGDALAVERAAEPEAPPPVLSPPMQMVSNLPAWEQRRLLRGLERATKEARREARNRLRLQAPLTPSQ
jgi:hypothetical protein